MKDSLSVSVHNLSKRYMLYEKPRDRLKHSLLRHFGKTYGHEFWALQDINFDLHRGETLGVIGRNGSGKSTLLQIIAGTLTATAGEVKINGRIAALLELGSGFNPDYTGRENIFMNGAVLGISHREMEGKIEEIISFADVGEFIDQPVKSYSSGMFVRLAFAVTTGLDAEVLLIDEALAVGDIFFRQKCYQRLEAFRQKGVSIILVSHAMNEVEQFCRHGLLLNQGKEIALGSASEVVKKYYLLQRQDSQQRIKPITSDQSPQSVISNDDFKQNEIAWPDPTSFFPIEQKKQVSNGWARCTGIALCNSQGDPCSVFEQGEMGVFFFEFEILRDFEVPIGGIVLQNEKSIIVHGKSSLHYEMPVPFSSAKGTRIRFRQDIQLDLAAGEYTFEVGLATISKSDFNHREIYPHALLDSKVMPICMISSLGPFSVCFRNGGKPIQLLHHGIANLPGRCEIQVI